MPIHNHRYIDNDKNPSPIGLVIAGPRLSVSINLPKIILDNRQSKNEPIPDAINGEALIDTGASHTCIDDSTASQLGLKIIDTVSLQTPSGTSTHNRYMISVNFVGANNNLPNIPKLSVIGADLKNQGILVLLGRDLLRSCVLVYNGAMGHFSISL